MANFVSRRRWLKGLAFAASAAAAALSPLLLRRAARAAAVTHKVSPASVQYRIVMGLDHGKHCGMCRYFIPGRAQGMGGMCLGGTCQLVAGPISPMGYCMLFKPRT